MEGLRLEAMEQETVEIVMRHAKAGKNMIAVGLNYLKTEIIDKVDEEGNPIGYKALSANEALRLIVEGAKLERLSSGMSESVSEHRVADVDGSPLRAVLSALMKMPEEDLDKELAAFQAGQEAQKERDQKGWTKEKLLAEKD